MFVDECHRTQSGKLHDAMRALLPEATLIGFTGTPLLKKDKASSYEVFGPPIHTYKYDEAVNDGVVLDLRYEARDIDQIKRMKTRWGSCNREAGRIWLNLELIKKPPRCLDYILVHEMVHLHERHHNKRFRALMDRYLPDWRLRRDLLNSAPLAHEDWPY